MDKPIQANPQVEAVNSPAWQPLTFTRIAFRLRHPGGEERFFGVLLALLALHLADAAVQGQGLGHVSYPLFPLAALILLPAFFALFVWSGRIIRTGLAAAFGLIAVFYGAAVNISHILITGIAGSDYTGILFTVAGIVLICLAFRIGLLGQRWFVQSVAVLLLLFVVINWVVGPAIQAGIATNAPRSASPTAGALGIPGAIDVTFPARDGVRLVGWYVPGQNNAAVILLHGSHVTRASTIQHLRMLVQAGYAVLAYDGRGHGQSAGPMETRAWHDDDDIAGAIDFLHNQPGNNPDRIAALGLSTGAMDALRASADGLPLDAIIADGAAATTYGDIALVDGQLFEAPLALSADWLSMRAIELLSGLAEPPSLVSIVGQIKVPVFLITSNNSGELTVDRAYADQIGGNATLWYVPDAGHIQALNIHPQDYAWRVTSFLKAALFPDN